MALVVAAKKLQKHSPISQRAENGKKSMRCLIEFSWTFSRKKHNNVYDLENWCEGVGEGKSCVKLPGLFGVQFFTFLSWHLVSASLKSVLGICNSWQHIVGYMFMAKLVVQALPAIMGRYCWELWLGAFGHHITYYYLRKSIVEMGGFWFGKYFFFTVIVELCRFTFPKVI